MHRVSLQVSLTLLVFADKTTKIFIVKLLFVLGYFNLSFVFHQYYPSLNQGFVFSIMSLQFSKRQKNISLALGKETFYWDLFQN